VRSSHTLAKTHASFDDPHLVSHAGLVPVMALAQRAGLGDLVTEHVRPGGDCDVNAQLKVGCLVAGMAAGADSIDAMDLLRHGAMSALFGGIRAPSTLGLHLRSYTWGNVSQLEKAGREFLAELAGWVPLMPGAGRPPQRPDQPRNRSAPRRSPQPSRTPSPNQEPRTSRTAGERQVTRARNHLAKLLVQESDQKRATGIDRWIEA
jgi:hypothetical protein